MKLVNEIDLLIGGQFAPGRVVTVPAAIPNQDEAAPGLSLLQTGETLKPSQNKIAIEKRSFRQIGNRRFLRLCRRFPRCFGPINNQRRNTIDDRVGTALAGP